MLQWFFERDSNLNISSFNGAIINQMVEIDFNCHLSVEMHFS